MPLGVRFGNVSMPGDHRREGLALSSDLVCIPDFHMETTDP